MRGDMVDLRARHADIYQFSFAEIMQRDAWLAASAPLLKPVPARLQESGGPQRRWCGGIAGPGCWRCELDWHRSLLLLRTAGEAKTKAPSDAGGGLSKKIAALNVLAHDSFHGPAKAGHRFAIGDAHKHIHDGRIL